MDREILILLEEIMRFTGIADKTFQAIVEEAHRIVTEKGAAVIKPEVAALIERMEVEISRSLATTAGTARVFRCPEKRMPIGAKIRLNYRLLSANPKEIIFTYAHELAHIIAEATYGAGFKRVGHGPAWKRVARALGDTGERCHAMDTTALQRVKKRYRWQCANQACRREYLLTPIKHNRAMAHRGYRCGSCAAPIDYMESPYIFKA